MVQIYLLLLMQLIKNQLFITIKIIHSESVTLQPLSSHKKRKKDKKTFDTQEKCLILWLTIWNY